MHDIDSADLRVPALGFGTWQLTGAACKRAVSEALAIGYRHIDTAQIYDNEAEVGAAIAESGLARERLFLTTKVWMDRMRRGALERSVEDSLKRLRTDYVDLLLIHWPNAEVPLEETLAALSAVREAGRTRAIGVSNFPLSWLRASVEDHGAAVVCDQVEYHPYLSQAPLLDYVRAHGLFLTAYCPLAQGRVADDPVLRRIGEAHGKSASQVALRWLIEQDRVAVIPKAAGAGHARSNFEIFDFELSAQERGEIDGLARGKRLIDPSWAPEWDAA